MATIEWDKVGDRQFTAGLDRGVLYLPNKTVPWNGLTGLDEADNTEVTSYYQDGVKMFGSQALGEYGATLKAFTYPDEFEAVMGRSTTGKGLYFHDQRRKMFGLSYRVLLGNDVSGADLGYELHLVYQLAAVPAGASRSTIGETPAPSEFSWALSATPIAIPGHRPTAHVSIKSTDMSEGLMEYLENILYGTETEDGYLPSMYELIDIIDNSIVIVDNGDGTWTATGSDRAVQVLSETGFQLNGVTVTYPDADTYTISNDH